MQHRITIQLDTELTDAIRENIDNKNDIFVNCLNQDNNSILNLLNNYDYYDGLQGEVYNYLINEDSIEIDEYGRRVFEVEFIAHHYFGCDDLNKEIEYEMPLTFIIDFNNNEMELTGELWEERNEDEI